jgi:outer membrane receptor for ferrienterochelin and colicin
LPSGEYPAHFLFRGVGDVGQTKFALYVDGVLQNDISNGWFRHVGYNFTLNNIERIELVSGPGSALYGANAFVGFVNVVTKEAYLNKNKNFEFSTNSFAGLNNTYNQDFDGWIRLKNQVSISLTGRYFQTNGDNGINRLDPGNYFNNNFEPDSVKIFNGDSTRKIQNNLVDGRSPQINDGFKTSINDYYLRAKINYKNFSITTSQWEKKESLGSYVVGYEYFANDSKKDFLANHSGRSFEMKYTCSPSQKLKSNSRAYVVSQKVLPETGFTYTYQFQDVEIGDSVTSNYKKSYESEGYLLGLEQQLNLDISSRHKLILGFQFEQKIREFFNINFSKDDAKSTLSSINESPELRPVFFSANGAGFLQHEFLLLNNLVLTSGLRYDYDEFYGRIFNPRMALVSSNPEGFKFKLLYGKGYKPPTIFELYDEWRGNNTLKPEIIHTSEIEMGYSKPKWTINANIFYSNLKNLIRVNQNLNKSQIGPDGQKADIYQNIGGSEVTGVALRGRWAPNKSLFISGNYQVLTDIAFGQLDNVTSQRLNFAANYLAFGKLNINIRGNWVGKIKAPKSNRYYFEKTDSSIDDVGYDYVVENNPDGFLDGHFILNMTLTCKNSFKGKTFNIEPFIKVNNLLNKKYAFIGRQSGSGVRPVSNIQSSIENPNGFIPAYHPQAGTTFLGGFRFNFN